MSNPGRMPGATVRPLYDLCRSDKCFRHGQQRWLVDGHGEICLTQQIHYTRSRIPSRHDDEGTRWRRRVGPLPSDKRRETRLRTCPNPIQHDILSNAVRCFPGMPWRNLNRPSAITERLQGQNVAVPFTDWLDAVDLILQEKEKTDLIKKKTDLCR